MAYTALAAAFAEALSSYWRYWAETLVGDRGECSQSVQNDIEAVPEFGVGA